MRLMSFLFNLGHGHKEIPVQDDPHVRRMGRLSRLFHRKARRHLLGVGLGTMLMLTGSGMAVNAAWALEHVPVPHVLWDMLAYFIHGFGALPVMSHIEPLWSLLAPAAE